MNSEKKDLRIDALKRFAIAISVLNLAGHVYLGFEASWAIPLVALLTAYSTELLFEWLRALQDGTRPKFAGGGIKKLAYFLLPAHISGLAVSMLLFTNTRCMPIVFAAAFAILSKVIFRVRTGQSYRHFFNPSNIGITSTLLLFPWVGIAPPYQFTENTSGAIDWLLPLLFIGIGSFLNIRFTRRIVLILSWFGGFVLQAALRSILFGSSFTAALSPITGVSFLLFSFYMISDPATTPVRKASQVLFGFSTAIVYGLLVYCHIVFGLFFSLAIVCTTRGAWLAVFPGRTEAIGRRLKERFIAVGTTARARENYFP